MAKEIREIINKHDIVVGTIADDRMNDAIHAFNDGALSDIGLTECLKYIDYGEQIVIKTDKINDIVHMINEKELYGAEADDIRKQAKADRIKSQNIVKEMKIKHRRNGSFIDEIEQMMINNEITIKDIFPNL